MNFPYWVEPLVLVSCIFIIVIICILLALGPVSKEDLDMYENEITTTKPKKNIVIS